MRGWWAVVKDMPQMSVATAAQNLVPLHPMGVVPLRFDIFFRDGLVEARPARAGLELGLGIEKNRIAADAMV